MATEANKDAAVQSLDIAKAALVTGNLEKAQRFADKAMKLYPSDEVCRSASAALIITSYSEATLRLCSCTLVATRHWHGLVLLQVP